MIQAEEIVYCAGNRKILKGVDIQVKKGELVGLIGPNGGGKSTLLKQIYKALRPCAGRLFLDGRDLLSMTNREMAQRMAVMVQEQEGMFDFTAEEVIMMGRQARKGLLERESREDWQRVEQILDAMGLSEIRRQSFASLSGGEKQRVLMGRVLAQDTSVVILDEPTNHLDICHQLRLMETVKKMGCTAVAALHDLNLAAAYCDRLYAVRDGRIAGTGTPRELITPEFVRDLYGAEAEVITVRDGTMRVIYYGTKGAYHERESDLEK